MQLEIRLNKSSIYTWWDSLMHRSNIPDTAILYHFIDDTDILHHYDELVSFFCLVKILTNFEEHHSVAITDYKIWHTENNKKEVKL